MAGIENRVLGNRFLPPLSAKHFQPFETEAFLTLKGGSEIFQRQREIHKVITERMLHSRGVYGASPV